MKKIKVPAGVKPGTKIRLKGLGFPVIGRAETRGDLFALIKMDVPKDLNPKQKDAIETLKELGL